jgi:hypothetical protein
MLQGYLNWMNSCQKQHQTHDTANDYYDQNQIKDIAKGGLVTERFGALKSDSTHHFFRNACTKSGSLRFSQFSGCWLFI